MMRRKKYFCSAELLEKNNKKDANETYQIPNEFSIAHATPKTGGRSGTTTRSNDMTAELFREKSLKISLSSTFSRQSKKYNIQKQNKNNNLIEDRKKNSDVWSKNNRNRKSFNLRGTGMSNSRHSRGWKSQMQAVQQSFRKSVRLKRNINDNCEGKLWRKIFKKENSCEIHSTKSLVQKLTDQKKETFSEIPPHEELTFCEYHNATRGKKSSTKTPSFVNGTLHNGSVADIRKSEHDTLPRKNNNKNKRRNRTGIKMFSQATSTHSLRGGSLTGQKSKNHQQSLFSKLWKPKSSKNDDFVSFGLSSANSTDLGFLLKRDPFLGSISSEDLCAASSEEVLYTWDFSHYNRTTRDKYRSLKRSRAALIFPQSANCSISLDRLSFRSGREFDSLENAISMEVLSTHHSARNPDISVDFYNDDGSILPKSKLNQNIYEEVSTYKENGGCDVIHTDNRRVIINDASNSSLNQGAETHSETHTKKVRDQRLHEQSHVLSAEEFCKCHLTQNSNNWADSDDEKITISNRNQRKLKTAYPRKSGEDATENNHGRYNLIESNPKTHLQTFASSESLNFLYEREKTVLCGTEQTRNTRQCLLKDDAQMKKIAQCYGDENLTKNKTSKCESVEACTQRELESNNFLNPNERCKPRLERQNAVFEPDMTHDVDFMKKTNIFSCTGRVDKTFHLSKLANGSVKINTRISLNSPQSCQLEEIKGPDKLNKPEFQNCRLSSKQNNMALKLDLNKCDKFGTVIDGKSGKTCSEDSPLSPGSPKISVSSNKSFELQSLDQDLQLATTDTGPVTNSCNSSSEIQQSNPQVLQENICPLCQKIIAPRSSPIQILKKPLPRYLSPPLDLEYNLSKSLPSLCSQDSGKFQENDSPCESPFVSPLSSSPESDSERGKIIGNNVPSKISPMSLELISHGCHSSSCIQLNEAGKPLSSPPVVAPRVKSFGQLSPMPTTGKKVKVTRHRGRMSIPFGDDTFIPQAGIGKPHSLSADSCSKQESVTEPSSDYPNHSLNNLSSLTLSSATKEDEVEGTVSMPPDENCKTNNHPGHSLERSVSVPMHICGGQNSRNSSESESMLPKGFSSHQSLPESHGSDSDDDNEVFMDAPEAFAEALWDHVTMDPEELSFSAGDIITIISWTDSDWWWGQVGDRIGWFPAPFVRVRVSQTLACEEAPPAAPLRSRRGTSIGALSNQDVRARVVQEILNTEKDYVKNLRDVVEGYLRQARKRPDMFSEEQLITIFSNVEQIYVFHKEILEQLRAFYNAADPCASEIGSVFLENKNGFDIYSEYCNNHPHSVAELKTMYENNKYTHFFEACRLLQEMVEISLDGFLLTPVQKICKYPLQLSELLKYTEWDHKDYVPVKMALDTMKSVAARINERKRKVECINKIAKWQSSIDGWEGEDVLQRSSELIHTGEVNKITKGNCQERVFFLFDHQLIYCKKDILKKNVLIYKGRIDMDSCQVLWLKDGEDHHNGSPLNNAWKMFSETDGKWCIVCTKKAEQRNRWIQAFQEERARIKEDANSGVVISQSTKQAAMQAAQSSVKGRKPYVKKDKQLRTLQSPGGGNCIKRPISPSIPLPAPVSSADLKEQACLKDKDLGGFLQRTSQLRRSFGLRGSKRSKDKEKRSSSVF